jgi:hypothetical protein
MFQKCLFAKSAGTPSLTSAVPTVPEWALGSYFWTDCTGEETTGEGPEEMGALCPFLS